MSGIPYNELQPIKITAKDDSGETAVLETLYFSIVIPCRDCRFSLAHGNGCGRNQDIYDAEPDGFCAWGERMVGE